MLKDLCVKLDSPFTQYLVGAFINLLCVIILITNNTSYQNLQLPEGIYSENRWHGGDVLTYVYPARNFIHFGVFGSGTLPDYRRTIGYPLFLAILMELFADYWLILAFFLQALIFASIYPALYRLSKILFTEHPDVGLFSFIFFIISGTYIAMVPAVMTDLFFAVFFTIGLYFGFESVIRKSWIFLLLHILFMGYSAQVRPVLALYPVINFLFLIYISNKYLSSISRKVYALSAVSTLSLIILCNLPSIRNYINYGFLAPTDIVYRNLFNSLTHDVLRNVGQEDRYDELRQSITTITNVNERIKVQQALALNICKEHPLTTLAQITKNAIGILIRSHWPIITNFWGYNFKDNLASSVVVRKSKFVFILECFFNVVYLIVFLLFSAYLIRHLRSENVIFALLLVLFVSYFLVPTFTVSGAGSRYRLPVEGIIILTSLSELRHRLEKLNRILHMSKNRNSIFATQ